MCGPPERSNAALLGKPAVALDRAFQAVARREPRPPVDARPPDRSCGEDIGGWWIVVHMAGMWSVFESGWEMCWFGVQSTRNVVNDQWDRGGLIGNVDGAAYGLGMQVGIPITEHRCQRLSLLNGVTNACLQADAGGMIDGIA